MEAEKDTELLDGHRNAHRVFRRKHELESQYDWLRFLNPFQHFAWVSPERKDLESVPRNLERERFRKFKFWIIETDKWPVPEEPFTISNQLKRTFLTSWINVLLICAPIGLVLSRVSGPSVSTFVVNYLAEVPLWFLCDYALEELEKYLSRRLSDLLDIFTNNTVQLISSILLIRSGEMTLLRTSLVGSILSNILVLLGLSLIIGGLTYHHQRFNRTGAQGSSSLLSIAVTSSLIPTAVKLLKQTTPDNLLKQSRGVSVVLLFIYVMYTFCQMVTHKEDYKDYGKSSHHGEDAQHRPSASSGSNPTASYTITPPEDATPVDSKPTLAPITRRRIFTRGSGRKARESAAVSKSSGDRGSEEASPCRVDTAASEDNEEILGPQLCFPVAAALFATTIVLLFFCIDATVSSLSTLTANSGANLSSTFVGLILLPVPNYDFAAVSLASDDYLGQAMKYTVGRSIQTALLVIPLVVMMSWGIAGDGGMTLALDGFEVLSLFTTILLLNFLVVDAKVHWVHGVLLLADFALIAIAAFYVSDTPM